MKSSVQVYAVLATSKLKTPFTSTVDQNSHIHFSMSLGKRKADGVDQHGPSKRAPGHWSMGLKDSMKDPSVQVFTDDEVVIIKDKYPKARHHFLVLPVEPIPNLKALEKKHLPLLQHMLKEGKAVADKIKDEPEFRFGYHSVPSMSHVHMHVISQDFDSPCLKTKKHWNSFASEYFIDATDVIEMLDGKGKVDFDKQKFEQYLKKDLKCHKCPQGFKTMPALKEHLKKHY